MTFNICCPSEGCSNIAQFSEDFCACSYLSQIIDFGLAERILAVTAGETIRVKSWSDTVKSSLNTRILASFVEDLVAK